jgi:hypothetical protein
MYSNVYFSTSAEVAAFQEIQWKAVATVSLDDGVIQVRNP